MRHSILALAALLILAAVPPAVSAQPQDPPSDWAITLSSKAWVSNGSSTWNFASAGINPLTNLHWRGVNVAMPEVSVDVIWKRWMWQMTTGGNTISQGVLVSEDFAQDNHQGRFSVTQSTIDGGYLVYVNNDMGARVLDWREPLFGGDPAPVPAAGYLDVFLGYQFWREQYVAYGLKGTLIFPSGLEVSQAEPNGTRFATNRFTRHSVRIGARSQIPLGAGLSLKVFVAISPYTHTDYEDTHFLQSGLQQPTISTANGGFGVQGEGGLTWNVWSGLSIEAGYRYWRFDSGSGEQVTTTTGGASVKSKVNEMITERYGPYFGLSWRF